MNSNRQKYMSGFGNFVETEAVPGALPEGRNSPQRAPLGLFAEKFSATAFTAPRADNFRSWLYRIRPSVGHGPFTRIDNGLLRTAPCELPPTPPDQLRWNPLPMPQSDADFIDGLATVAVNGDVFSKAGIAIHIYRANSAMKDRYFCNADGEMLFVPELGSVTLRTELGLLEVEPGEIAVVPRGIRFQLSPAGKEARGYIGENYGAPLKLPERGPIGTDGLANSRDFLIPVAAFEDKRGTCEIVTKLGGNLFRCEMGHSPLDVVAWHGNLAPCKYDLRRFNTIGSISYDHPDPSIFTVLTSHSDTAGVANIDFVVFPPRWLVMENTFRPPWFHRNVMSEYMGLIYGEYDAKTGGGFVPGGASLHNCMSPHGPDANTFEKASEVTLAPGKVDNTMAFMFESRYLIRPTHFALDTDALQTDYLDCWSGLEPAFTTPEH